ncbi:MAG: alanine racemase [Alphaproteobacteria bacterium]|nr:alanine racemase [Alphaproteobacteria bacterium]
MTAARHAPATLTIDLAALRTNYRRLREQVHPAICAAVVKADAYGLGARRVAPALAAEGCRQFFVAQVDEGIALRRVLGSADIYVLGGALPGSEAACLIHGLRPVLNSLEEIRRFAAVAHARRRLPVALHIDTGMARLGLDRGEFDQLLAAGGLPQGLDLALVLSHLACADTPAHPLNRRQRERFTSALTRLPRVPASLANSSGIFLGTGYHFDLVRPGIALYGGNPLLPRPNPMREVVRLEARILQVRNVDRGTTVGYGATHTVPRRGRIATVGAGYADGYVRSLGNAGFAAVGDVRVPIVGRVSMDLITLDVSALPATATEPGTPVTLIGGACPIDEVAAAGGTIAYELLTSLGQRYHRRYHDGSGAA